MKNLNTVLTATEVRNLNLTESTTLSFDYLNIKGKDNHYLVIDGENKLNFANASIRRKSYEKIRRMGFGWGYVKPIQSDEDAGIMQAHQNGENPFAYTMICADPSRNVIVR